MADQLPIVGTTYTMQALVPGGVERCHAQMSAHLPAGVALTPHAPAQSALDELRGEVERLSLYENLATEYGLSVFAESAQVIEELRREVEALRADAARYRWLARNFDELWSTFAPEEGSTYNSLDIAIDTARASTGEGAGK